MGWTNAQQAAIDKRHADILVSAAAGSGKTAVLTERVMNRIAGTDKEEPIPIDRFLIVTFTSAAANEMKERISGKLSDGILALQNEEVYTPEIREKIAYLEKQISLIQTASISTIHSFCLKVIKSYFNKLEIDPNIKVAHQAELSIMKMEILEGMLEEKLDEGETGFLRLAEIYGSVQGMAPLMKLILEVHSFSKSTPFPEVWLDEKVRMLCSSYKDLEEMPWSVAIKSNVCNQLEDLLILYQEAVKLCDKANGPELYKELLEEDIKQIEEIDFKSTLSEIITKINHINFGSLPRKKQDCDEGLKEQVKAYRNLVKDSIKDMKEDLAFINDYKVVQTLPFTGELMKELVELIKIFEDRYQMSKQTKGIVDYNDLEHLCMKVLIEPQFDISGLLTGIVYTDAAKELSQFYKEVYIDEYQDSNTVQEMILSAIAQRKGEQGPTRFMVGDMKQSIYRFRLANPLIFADKYEKWEKYLGEEESSAEQVCIDLSQNFRSRKNILAGVNDLFSQLMSKEVGELEYDEYASLKVGNLYQEGILEEPETQSIADTVEVHLLETKIKEEQKEALEDEDEMDEMKSVEWEALMTATLIDKLLKGEGNPTHLYDKEIKAYRKIEPRDIVILLRATKDKAAVFENALINKGIGAYADIASSFFEAIEVETMIAFMKIIDNPLQDIPLITVLRSPIVGVSLDDLVIIRKASDTGCFYEALKAYLLTSGAKDSIKQFAQLLQSYRVRSNHYAIEELLSDIYVESGYYRYVSMLPTGAKKKANLRMLRKYAEEFEENTHGKLFSFIHYLDQLKETGEGLEEAKLIGESENLVRIMSIHKSKGLEFGVVFLCDTAKRFNHKDVAKSVLLHHELGFAPEFIDIESHVKYPTIPKMAVKSQILRENISEEMRVLYVALTRAKEKLFITGVISDFSKKTREWSLFGARTQQGIVPLGIRRAGSYLNWIGMSLYAHSGFGTIRDNAQIASEFSFEGTSKWHLQLWDKTLLSTQGETAKSLHEVKEEILSQWDSEKEYGRHKEEIYRRLNFKYKYQEAVILPTKLSVSEIKQHTANQQQQEKRVPIFMRENEPIKGAQRGTLIHSIFEHLDFLQYTKEEEIREAIENLVVQQKVQQEALQVVDIKRLAQFASSDRIVRMRKAKHVWKEKQFVYLEDAKVIDDSYPANEKILIQGMIDTFFIEEDGIVIIDYKTDFIDVNNREESIAALKERYRVQLDFYARAIGEMTRKPVKEKCIYLYHINQWITL